MQQATFAGVALEYELCGEGEPIVLVHHGIGVDWFRPLQSEPVLGSQFRLLRDRCSLDVCLTDDNLLPSVNS
jgi:hypothetical protein